MRCKVKVALVDQVTLHVHKFPSLKDRERPLIRGWHQLAALFINGKGKTLEEVFQKNFVRVYSCLYLVFKTFLCVFFWIERKKSCAIILCGIFLGKLTISVVQSWKCNSYSMCVVNLCRHFYIELEHRNRNPLIMWEDASVDVKVCCSFVYLFASFTY